MSIRKRISSCILLLLVVALLVGVCMQNASAWYHECSFKTKSGKECDVCIHCRALRVHPTDDVLPFVTVKENVVSHSEPRKTAPIVNTYDEKYTELGVVGRLRNESSNLWLELEDGSFVYTANVAFNLDSYADVAFNTISYVIRNESEKCQANLCDAQAFYTTFISAFETDGWYDMKTEKLLGNKKADYYLYYSGKTTTTKFKGDEIGNILYGYLCHGFGLSEDRTIYYGGMGHGNLPERVTCAVNPLFPEIFCDNEYDIARIQAGYRYYATGKLKI